MPAAPTVGRPPALGLSVLPQRRQGRCSRWAGTARGGSSQAASAISWRSLLTLTPVPTLLLPRSSLHQHPSGPLPGLPGWAPGGAGASLASSSSSRMAAETPGRAAEAGPGANLDGHCARARRLRRGGHQNGRVQGSQRLRACLLCSTDHRSSGP